MPHPDRPPRLDGYAKPLPELTDARYAITSQEPQNERARAILREVIDDTCLAVMRLGWTGHVYVRFSVHNGIVQSDIYSGLERNHQPRNRRDERGHS